MSLRQLLQSFSNGFSSRETTIVFRVVLVTWGVLLLCGYLFVVTDLLPERFSWTASMILLLSAVVVFLSERRVRSVRRNRVIVIVLFFAVFVVEYVGMRTGIPFGAYTYTDALGFRLAGVPVAIVAAWYTTIMITRTMARAIVPSGIAAALAAGVLTLAFDIALEPMASFITKYWEWKEGAIPLTNYASWFGLSTLVVVLLERYDPLPAGMPTKEVLNTSTLVFFLQFGLFLVADSFSGHTHHAAIAMIPFGLLAIWWRMRRHPLAQAGASR